MLLAYACDDDAKGTSGGGELSRLSPTILPRRRTNVRHTKKVGGQKGKAPCDQS